MSWCNSKQKRNIFRRKSWKYVFIKERSHSSEKFVPVAVRAVKWESKIRTGSWTTCLHPAHKNLHQFGSILCWCSPRMGIWNRVHEIQSLKINVGRYFILETLKHVLYTLQYIRLQYIATFKKRKQKLQREYLASCLWSFEKTWETNQEWLWSLQKRYSNI